MTCLLGCAATEAPSDGAEPSVLLITVDALRCDALDEAGWQGRLVPRLSELRSRPDAWSGCAVAASSVPETALASLLTGVDPISLGRRAAEPGSRVGGLALHFEALGYRTHALLASPPPVGGLLEDFQIVERHLGIAEMVETVASLSGDGPWFTWVHLSRTRPPWAAVEAYRPRLPSRERERATGEISRGELAALATSDDERRQRARLLYSLNLAAVDNQIGLLIDAVAEGSPDEVVLTAVVGSEGVDLGETAESGFATGLSRPQLEVAMVLVGIGAGLPALEPTADGPPSATRLPATLARWAGLVPSPAMAPALGEPGEGSVSAYWTRRGVRVSWLEAERQWLVFRGPEDGWSSPRSRGWGDAGEEGRGEVSIAAPAELRRRLEGRWQRAEPPWTWSSSEARSRAGLPQP